MKELEFKTHNFPKKRKPNMEDIYTSFLEKIKIIMTIL